VDDEGSSLVEDQCDELDGASRLVGTDPKDALWLVIVKSGLPDFSGHPGVLDVHRAEPVLERCGMQ